MVKRYVINLERRPDRLSEFLDRFADRGKPIPLVATDGVDGPACAFEEGMLSRLRRSRILRFDHSAGAFGCFRSHMRLWDELASGEAGAFTIFEDDAFFVDGFGEKLRLAEAAVLEGEADLLFLGGRFVQNFTPMNFMSDDWVRKEVRGLTLGVPASKRRGRNFDRTTHAYTLSREGARQLLDRYYSEDAESELGPVDVWLHDVKFGMKAFEVVPHLCWSPNAYKSDIRTPRVAR